jgi:toluene monooxygenase system protein D
VNREPAGPVLEAGPIADAIAAAMRQLDPEVETIDRGSYVRVVGRGGCRVTRAAIEAQLGHPFVLPGDLERVMPSFRGRFYVDEEEARWVAGGEP